MTRVHLPKLGELALRPMAYESDRALILGTWLNSVLAHFPRRRRGREALPIRLYAERSLASHRTVVACSPDHPTVIHGWACGDPDAGHLDFVYVPFPLRGLGLGRSLITECLLEYRQKGRAA